jgi:hypothetical protein
MPPQYRPPVIAPKLAPGDADKIAELMEANGLPLVPWQREFLKRLEAASADD